MAVYADAYQVGATVGRITARWSHLTADTRDELHEFTDRLGLRREWFQDHPIRWHYDVTENMRRRALRLGAVEIGYRELAGIMAGRREAQREAEDLGDELRRSTAADCRYCRTTTYLADNRGPAHRCCIAWREVILAGYPCPSCQVAGYYLRWETAHPGRPAPKLHLNPLPALLPDGRRFAPDIGGRFAVTASREWEDEAEMRRVLGPYRHRGLVLVHGAARGGDTMAARIWREWGEADDPHPADWAGPCHDTCKPGHRKVSRGREYCPAAGMYRNSAVIAGAFVLEAFIRDASPGATGCVKLAQAQGVKVNPHEHHTERQAEAG